MTDNNNNKDSNINDIDRRLLAEQDEYLNSHPDSVSNTEFEVGGNGHDYNNDEFFVNDLEREEIIQKEQHKKRSKSKGKTSQTNEDDNDNNEQTPKIHTVYKYSTDIPLAEEILLDNESVFLQIIDGKPQISSMIDLRKQKGIVLIPHENSSQVIAPVVIPYSFKNVEEIEYFIKIAKEKSIDDLFLMSESIWDKILVAKSKEVITFYTVDTIYSYFQDLFPTTHYDMIVGNPGAGKGAILVSFRLQGYRAVMAAGMSGANLLELLGSVEACQITLLEDEFQNIEKDPDKEVIYKIGYDETNLVPKTLDGNKSNRHNRWYHPYCFKVFASEKASDSKNLGGFNDRTFRMKSLKGRPKILAKNILHEFQKSIDKQNPKYKDIISKINYLRKLLLIYRILHHEDIIEEVALNIDGRAMELTSPQIYLFSSDKLVSKEEDKRVLHTKVLPALSKFLKEKGEISGKTIEGIVYQALQELFESNITAAENTLDVNNDMRTKYTLTYDDICMKVTELISGDPDLYHPQTINSLEYDQVTHNELLKICRDRFSENRDPVTIGTGNNRKKALVFFKEDVEKSGKSFDVITEIEIMDKQPEESAAEQDQILWKEWKAASTLVG
jgi:hypothetical protein